MSWLFDVHVKASSMDLAFHVAKEQAIDRIRTRRQDFENTDFPVKLRLTSTDLDIHPFTDKYDDEMRQYTFAVVEDDQ